VPVGQPTPMQITIAILPLIAVFGVLVLGAYLIWRRGKLAEMTHRERLAMIERGLAPPPEISDREKTMTALSSPDSNGTRVEPLDSRTHRFRSVGVTLIGIGVALMLIIGVAADAPESGIGVGGAFAALGAAMVVNAYLDRGRAGATRRDEKLTLAPTSRDEAPPL
jgi:hypothetical protein